MGVVVVGVRAACDAGGREVLAMSAGSSLEDAGFATYEEGATGTSVVGAARGWRLHVSLEASALGQPSRLALIPTQLTRLPPPVLHFFRERSEVKGGYGDVGRMRVMGSLKVIACMRLKNRFA